MKKILLLTLSAFLLFSCDDKSASSSSEIQKEAQKFLHEFNRKYVQLSTAASEAHWKANTYIVEGDTATENAVQRAEKAYSKYTGSSEVIEKTQKFLEKKDQLSDLQVRQLKAILYGAANNPETAGEVLDKRIKAEAEQTKKLFGYEFLIYSEAVSPNEIDAILDEETDTEKRLAAWESSKEVGKGLKEGLVNLRSLRNQTVQSLGYDDYFSYQVSAYEMEREEMLEQCRGMIRDIWPLYRELHTWARYELADRYGEKVPEMLPAHWLPNRWGQDWAAMVEVKGLDIDGALKEKEPEWLIKQAERFYQSVGFEALPQSFYDKSSLYPAPEDAEYKKNNHASAWHVDLDQDVRCLQSLVPNARWYETTHHELGHIYYYLCYSNDSVPPLLREGANRAFHEAFGSLLGLAAMQQPFIEGIGLIEPGADVDETQVLLKEALNYIILIPWGAGVMTEFENSLYAEDLPEDEFNKKWWELKEKYQGISAPGDRGEEFCDACSKTHINNDAAQYYDYALSFVLLFQFHDHIAENILNQDPHATNYFGNKEVGKFLTAMMSPGGTRDWQELMETHMGTGLSAKPMLEYFDPLMKYLKEVNEGREHTLPENI